MAFFQTLKQGLSKTRQGMIKRVESVLGSFAKIDQDLFDEIEEILITSDVGVKMTCSIINNVKDKIRECNIKATGDIMDLLKAEMVNMLACDTDNNSLHVKAPKVILVVGVNGVGKTTSIGKIANNYKKQGHSVLAVAADTFRAAAIEQLEVWGKRSGVEVVKHMQGSDPAAVVFDALQAAKSRKIDVVICDTAGRLHTKKNLMEELKKIHRVIDREMPDASKHTLLVLDATTGQNAISQAKLFKEAVDVNGIVLTKLDGTAKGGIVLSIKSELNIPIEFIGVGEGIDDLQKFNATEFVSALFEG